MEVVCVQSSHESDEDRVLVCDNVNQVAGTEVRANLRSIRLSQSRERNSTLSASFPTASSNERSETLSSKRERALSPATTVPFRPTE